MGGWQVICWALVIALPMTVIPTLLKLPAPETLSAMPVSAILSFLYLALFSQLIGFFFWYQGLASGGVAPISQLQLLQPFLTLFASAWLLNEFVDARTWLFAFLVIFTVALNRRTRITHSQLVKTP
jgi:drug/metabolite transporter (DMT)-like permease